MQIFISYKTNAEPDRALCDALAGILRARNHQVFVDRQMQVGTAWAAEIESALASADYLVLLLSKDSAHSEMVLGEVEKARSIALKRLGAPKILPVRVAFQGTLPYPLSSYIDKLQHARWEGPSDTETVGAALLRVLEAGAMLPLSAEQEVRELSTRPTAQAQVPLRSPGGTLDVEDPFYVERTSDHQALSVLKGGPGQTITIKGPRQVGKSSLLMRLLASGMNEGRQVAFVDFQLIAAARGSERDWAHAFLHEVLTQLNLPLFEMADWDERATPSQNCTALLDRFVLRAQPKPLMLACDEADLILSLPFRDNFFGMLRAWHGRRGNPVHRARWGQLDMLLVTSTEPYLFISKPEQSPFNVGTVLTLEDFSREQLALLNTIHGEPLAPAEVAALHELTGGHPYLVRKGLYAASGKGLALPWRDVLRLASDESGPFGDHLRRRLLNLSDAPELRPVFARILAGHDSIDEVAAHRLEGAGLVRRHAGRSVPRCNLYAEYFHGRV